MPSKNDLSDIKIETKNTLESVGKMPITTAWRKAKAPAEKQSEVIGLRFTPSEKAHIEELAGLVPVATFLKDKLMKQTDLAKK